MKCLSIVLVSIVACAFFAKAQANFIDDLKDKVGLGDDHDEEKKHGEHDKHKDSLYQGGFKKQLAHTAADAGADRLIEMGKERLDNPLLNPIISMAGSALKKKLHTRINEFGQEEEVEGDDEHEHEARENRHREDEHEEHRHEEEEDKHHHHHHHHDDDDEEGEKKKGGLSGLLGLSRRKRDTAADQVEESKSGQLNAKQGAVSKVVTGIKNTVVNAANAGKKIGNKIVSAVKPSSASAAQPAKAEPKIEVKVEKVDEKKD